MSTMAAMPKLAGYIRGTECTPGHWHLHPVHFDVSGDCTPVEPPTGLPYPADTPTIWCPGHGKSVEPPDTP